MMLFQVFFFFFFLFQFEISRKLFFYYYLAILSGLRNKLEEEEQVHPMVAVEIPKEQKTEPIKKEETKPNTQEKRTSKRLIQKLNKIFSLEQVQAKDDPMDIVPVA